MAVPDAVMVRLGAEIDYFGLAVLRQLEIMDVRVFNSVNSMEISRDKMYTHQVLSRNGINIPRSFLAVLPTDFKTVVKTVGLPVICKALSGARGDQVWKFDSNEEFQKGLEVVQKEVEGSPVVMQEFVANSSGRDLRVVVVKGKAVAGMMRVANSGFKANVHQGGRVEKIVIESRLKLWRSRLPTSAISTSRVSTYCFLKTATKSARSTVPLASRVWSTPLK